MHDCGHTQSFRCTVFSRVLGRYNQNLANHNSNQKVMFRSRQEREKQIESDGGKKTRSNWFRGGKDRTTSTTTVPATPGGVLADQIRNTLAGCPAPGRCRTKVLQGGGVSVKRTLVRTNPFPRVSCGREDCLMDKYGQSGCKEACYRESVGYCATCTRCTEHQLTQGKTREDLVDHSYTGETARSIYTRSKQHLSDYRSHFGGRKAVNSWMWDHTAEQHGGVVGPDQGAGDYTFRSQGCFEKPLQRQVDEAVRLSQIEKHGRVLCDKKGGRQVVSQNSRGEFYTPKIVQYRFEN